MSFVEKNESKAWGWCGVSGNPNVSIEFIDAHPEKDWDWYGVSQNPNLTIEYIDAHPEKDWDWEGISWNKFGWTSTRSYWNSRRSKTIDQTSIIKEELIAKACHPDRKNMIECTLDIEECKSFYADMC